MDCHTARERPLLRRHACHRCGRAGELDPRRHRRRAAPGSESSRPVDCRDRRRTLAITLRSQRTDAPLALAHTDLAIAKSVPDSLWPLGTRRSDRIDIRRVDDQTGRHLDDSAPCRPFGFSLLAGDPRDLLDEGVDLLLTRDPAALDYAATLPQFQSVPLPWQRTHVLLTPGRPRTAPSLSEEARQALADDAVRGEARGAMGPFWWEVVADCEVAASQPRDSLHGRRHESCTTAVTARRAIWPNACGPVRHRRRTDPRCTPTGPRRTYQRATGLTGEALALARRRGTDAGYIMSLDSRPLDPCRELQVVCGGRALARSRDHRPAG